MRFEDFQRALNKARLAHPTWFALDAEPAATEQQISIAESELGLSFPSEYREFLRNYGGGYFAFATVLSVAPNSEWNIVEANKKAALPVSDFLIFSDNGTGDYYGFRGSNASVWVWDHDERAARQTRYTDIFDFLASVALTP